MNTILCQRNSTLIVMTLIIWMASYPDGVSAQTELANPKAYKEAKVAATKTFLDRNQPKEKRLAAAEKLGYPSEETFAALLKIATDVTEDDRIRWEAIRRHPYDEKYIAAVLEILGDPRDGGEEFNAKLIADLNRRTVFLPDPKLRQRIQAALRERLKDPRDLVRLQAYRTLVPAGDSVAVKQLSDGLADDEPPVPLPEAIDLLDQAGSVNHIAALRPYLGHDDPEVQAQAAKALAVDPESRPQIVRLVSNPDTPAKVRLLGIRALAREDDKFSNYALPLLKDSGEKIEIRRAAMNAFAGRMNYTDVNRDDQIDFSRAVETLANQKNIRTDEGKKAVEAAQELLPYLQKHFPAIRKYYEER